jgi:antitoxin VapB
MKKTTVFVNGRSQAIRIPKEYRFNDKEVFIDKIGSVLRIMSIKNSWSPFLESLNNFSEDFMKNRNQPEEQKREDIF